MKRKIVYFQLLAIVICLVSFSLVFLSYPKKQQRYTIQFANADFPILFENVTFSDELEVFAVNDLNNFSKHITIKSIALCKPVSVKTSDFSIIVSNRLNMSQQYIPEYVDSSFKEKFGYIYFRDKGKYILIPESIMDLYKKQFSVYKTNPKVFQDLNRFLTTILPNLNKLDFKEILKNIEILSLLNEDIDLSDKDIQNVADEIAECASNILPYSILFVCTKERISEQLDKREQKLFKDFLYFLRVQSYDEKKEPYIRTSELLLGYTEGEWKVLWVLF